MFKSLHALAQTATLMIIVTSEDDSLRVSVTPTKIGDKAAAPTARPLSLVGTPDELDAGFAEALAEWQAPKRSLIEQARDSASDSPKAAASKTKAKSAPAPAPATKPGKGSTKTKAAAVGEPAADGAQAVDGTADGAQAGDDGAAGEPAADGVQAADATADSAHAGDDAAAGEPAADGAQAGGESAVDAPAADGAAPAADTFTLDLF